MKLVNFNLYLIPSVIQAASGILLMIPITTYYLDPKDFGVVAIIVAIVAPIGPLASSGCSWVLGGNYFKLENEPRKELLFNLVLVDFVMKSIWVFLFWVGSQFLLETFIQDYQPEFQSYFTIALLGVWAGMFWPTVSQLIILQRKAKMHFVLEIVRWLVGMLVTLVCLIWFKLGLVSLLIGPLAANLVSLMIEVWIIIKNSLFRLQRKWMEEVVRVGLPSIPANLSETIGNMADRYFIQTWFNFTQLGLYSHAQSYTTLFKMFNKSFQKTISPDALKAFSNNQRDKASQLESMVILVFMILLSMGVVLTLYSYDIVNILTHGKFVAAAPLVPLWFLIIFSFIYGSLYTQYLIAKKKNKILMLSMATTSIIFIGVTALGTYYFGVYGAVLSIVGSNFTIQLWRRIYSRKMGCTINLEKYFIPGMCIFAVIYYLTPVIGSVAYLKPAFVLLFLIVIGPYIIKNINLLKSLAVNSA